MPVTVFGENFRLLADDAEGFNDESTGVIDEESLSEEILSSFKTLDFFNQFLLNYIQNDGTCTHMHCQ